MASTPPKPLKQLGEFLQEQQEPFILEVYLLERGCLKKRLNSEGNFSCCHRNSPKFLKRSVSCGLKQENNGIPRWSKLLKAVYKVLDSIKEDQRTKSSKNIKEEYNVTAMVEDDQEVKESERFSSASSTTVFNSCSETEEEEISNSPCKYHTFFDGETLRSLSRSNIRAKEAATGRKLRRICMEDSKQLNPMSVLEQLCSHEEQRNARLKQEENCTPCPKKVFEDSVSLAPLPKARCKGVAESQGLGEYSNPSPQFLKQTKQLLFDCVREVVQTHAKKERGQQRFLGPEELGKLICERMKLWGKQAGDETNIVFFLGLDFLDSVKEWRSFEQQKREIELEIGDAVLEDIKDEIVTEMIGFLAPPRR